MPLPEGFPMSPETCNCALDAASIGLMIFTPVLTYALGYAMAWFKGRGKDER